MRATPQGRNSVDRGDRPACCGNASCIPVCPVQAKYDATVHLALAEAKGAQLHEKTTAVFVELGADRRVGAIRFKRWDGSEGRATAKVFVIAAHAIETPRLLLASRSEATPNGVANGSDQLGRNLMDHPSQLSWALADQPLWPYRGPLSTSGIENLRDGDFRRQRAAYRIEIGNDGWSWPTGAPITTAQDLARQGLRGKALDAAILQQTSRHIRLASLMEQLPDPENRVTLDPAAKGYLWRAAAAPGLSPGRLCEGGLAAARKSHGEIFARLGTQPRSSTVRRRKGRAISSAPRAWGAIPRPPSSIATCAATTMGICSSWDRRCFRPRRPPTRR